MLCCTSSVSLKPGDSTGVTDTAGQAAALDVTQLQLQVEGQDYSSQKVCGTPTPTSVGPFQSPLCWVKKGIEFSHSILSDCIFHIVSQHNQSYVPQINP